MELAVTYTTIYFLGTPFISLSNYLIAIFRAKGDSKTPLIVLTFAGVLNVALNLFFVVGVGMSVEGVAMATAISNLFSGAVLIYKLIKDENEYTRFSFKKLKLDVSSFKDIVRVGLPAGVQSALYSISNMLIQSSIVKVNNNMNLNTEYQPVVKGSAAEGNLENFVYTAMNAVYQGAITFTSQNIGADRPDRVRRILYSCIVIVSTVGIVMSLLFYFLRDPLLALYGVKMGEEGSLEYIAYETALIRCYFLGLPYFLCGIMDVCTGVLRGLGKSLTSTIISLLAVCAFRIVWLMTVFEANQTLEMIFISYPISWILAIVADLAFIRFILKKLLKEKALREKTERITE